MPVQKSYDTALAGGAGGTREVSIMRETKPEAEERGSLLKLVDRESYRRLHWEGSFDDYLDIVGKSPLVTRNAHQRLYDMIMSFGRKTVTVFGKKVPHYNIFDDPEFDGTDALFGLDEPLSKLVEVVKAGAHEWEVNKRLILLYGPVGTAKSTIARILKKYTELYSRTDEGALYTFSLDPNIGALSTEEFDWEGITQREGIEFSDDEAKKAYLDEKIHWILGSESRVMNPLNEEPLKLVPPEARKEFLADVNKGKKGKDRVRIQGDLNPQTRFMVHALAEMYGGDWTRVIENHVVVHRVALSEIDKVGVTTFEPGDEKNQDSTDLTGDVNWINVPKYGSDADPRAFSFDGEFHKGNRGILEFVEVLKLDPEFLYILLGATAERKVKPKKQPQTFIDLVPIGHTNPFELERMQGDESMEAFRDRIIRIDVPYVLRWDDEERIYMKSFNDDTITDKHVAPHTLRMVALWALLTRYDPSNDPRIDEIKKAKLLNGKILPSFSEETIRNILDEASKEEGMHGISPRFVQNVLGMLLARVNDETSDQYPDGCLSPFNVLPAIEGELYVSTTVDPDERERYLELLTLVREEYNDIIKEEVRQAIFNDEDAFQRLFDNYIDNVTAYVNSQKVKNPATGKYDDPNERLMRSIEEKLEPPVGQTQAREFRNEVVNHMASLLHRGKKFDYTSDDQLRRAVELKLFDDMKDSILIHEHGKVITSPETKEFIDKVHHRLLERGYCPICADHLLDTATSLLNRGDPE